MNFLFNTESCSVFGFSNDDIKVEKCRGLFDAKTGKEISYNYEIGTTYICKEKWKIYRGCSTIKEFDTEEEAKAELNRIITELEEKGNKIIKV